MKKLSVLAISLLLTISLASCNMTKQEIIETSFVAVTYTVQVAEVIAILPDTRFQIKRSVATLRTRDFSIEKQPVMTELLDEVDSMMNKIDAVATKDAKTAIILAGNVKAFVNQARLVYARIIDLTEGESFTDSQQVQFEVLRSNLRSINNLYKKVEGKGGDITNIIMQAIQAIGTGIKLVEAYN